MCIFTMFYNIVGSITSGYYLVNFPRIMVNNLHEF